MPCEWGRCSPEKRLRESLGVRGPFMGPCDLRPRFLHISVLAVLHFHKRLIWIGSVSFVHGYYLKWEPRPDKRTQLWLRRGGGWGGPPSPPLLPAHSPVQDPLQERLIVVWRGRVMGCWVDILLNTAPSGIWTWPKRKMNGQLGEEKSCFVKKEDLSTSHSLFIIWSGSEQIVWSQLLVQCGLIPLGYSARYFMSRNVSQTQSEALKCTAVAMGYLAPGSNEITPLICIHAFWCEAL